VFITDSSEYNGKDAVLNEFEDKSLKNGFDKVPDFIFVSFTKRKLVLNRFSCFSAKSLLLELFFIEKYSSWREEL
jgi:hypothetical protein